MKKSFLTTCVALIFLTATAQENSYIVKTRGAKKVQQQTEYSSDDVNLANPVDETARDFISDNFRFYSLCDWQDGMKFMGTGYRRFDR